MLIRSGHRYPVRLRPEHFGPDPDQRICHANPITLAPELCQLVERVQFNYPIENSPLLCFVADDNEQLVVAQGWYRERLLVVEALSHDDLAVRQCCAKLAHNQPFRSGVGRCSGLAVAAVVVINWEEHRWLLLGKRSATMAIAPGLSHVIAGGVEPGPNPCRSTLAQELDEEIILSSLTEQSADELAAQATFLGVVDDLVRWELGLVWVVTITAVRDPRTLDLLNRTEHDQHELVSLTNNLDHFWSQHTGQTLMAPGAGAIALAEQAGMLNPLVSSTELGHDRRLDGLLNGRASQALDRDL